MQRSFWSTFAIFALSLVLVGCSQVTRNPSHPEPPPDDGPRATQPAPPRDPSQQALSGWRQSLVPDKPYNRVTLSDRASIGDTFDAFLASFGAPTLVGQGQELTTLSFIDGQVVVTLDNQYRSRGVLRNFAINSTPNFRRTHSTVTLDQARDELRSLLPKDAKLQESKRIGNYAELGETYFSPLLKTSGVSGYIHVAFGENKAENTVYSIGIFLE
jgi:hypothetical protein